MISKSILAIIVAAVVVVAGVGAYLVLSDDEDSKSYEEKSDFTLLDSTSNVKTGMIIEMKVTDGPQPGHITCKVVDIVGTKVIVSVDGTMKIQKDDSLFLLYPYTFDYTSDEILEGITVEKKEDTYTINGTYAYIDEDGDDVKLTYNNLVVTYADYEVTYGKGTVTYTAKEINGGYTFTQEIKGVYSTKENIISSDAEITLSGREQYDIDDFFDERLNHYDEDEYIGCEVTVSEEKYGNVTAKVYTINGTNSDDEVYEDYKIYLYKGIVLKECGKIDNVYFSGEYAIYF